MADVFIHRTIRIEAETVGDLVKFMRFLENEEVSMSTPLESKVTIQVAVDEAVD